VLRKEFGPKKEDLRGGLEKLYNELHNLCCSPNIIRVMKSMEVAYSKLMVDKKNSYIIVTRVSEAKKQDVKAWAGLNRPWML
jgi:CII-binding regulator of phage lambda lysogenization HflD